MRGKRMFIDLQSRAGSAKAEAMCYGLWCVHRNPGISGFPYETASRYRWLVTYRPVGRYVLATTSKRAARLLAIALYRAMPKEELRREIIRLFARTAAEAVARTDIGSASILAPPAFARELAAARHKLFVERSLRWSRKTQEENDETGA